MQKFTHQIQNRTGLHARVAIKIFHFSLNHRPCVIRLKYRDTNIRTDRLIEMINAPAKKGEDIIFEIEGEHEESILHKLQSLCNKIL